MTLRLAAAIALGSLTCITIAGRILLADLDRALEEGPWM